MILKLFGKIFLNSSLVEQTSTVCEASPHTYMKFDVQLKPVQSKNVVGVPDCKISSKVFVSPCRSVYLASPRVDLASPKREPRLAFSLLAVTVGPTFPNSNL